VSTQTQHTPKANEDIIGDDWFDTHADYLFNFPVGQVRNVAVAEDLVQNVLVAALKARVAFRGQSSVRTWLAAILRHKICDHQLRSFRERLYRRERKPLA
jgi:RNA polymerase sigma-70 factor (ECF subfamily)